MIYDFPEPSSPIGQGDIFFGVPILDLPDDQLPVIGDDDTPRLLPWEGFASAGERVSAVIKTLFSIDKWLGEGSAPEDKTEPWK